MMRCFFEFQSRQGIAKLWVLAGVAVFAFLLFNLFSIFIEQQTLSLQSRTFSDLRSLELSLNTYKGDFGVYPPAAEYDFGLGETHPRTTVSDAISSPEAYIVGQHHDQYSVKGRSPYAYATDGDSFIIYSPGPDGRFDIHPDRQIDWSKSDAEIRDSLIPFTYDPTNGIVDSAGDIHSFF